MIGDDYEGPDTTGWPAEADECVCSPEYEDYCSRCGGSGYVCPMPNCGQAVIVRFGSAKVWGEDILWPTCTACDWEGSP